MSSGTESGESGDWGKVGTNCFGDGAAAFGVGGVFAAAFGAAAGAGEMAKVVEARSSNSEKDKRIACVLIDDL